MDLVPNQAQQPMALKTTPTYWQTSSEAVRLHLKPPLRRRREAQTSMPLWTFSTHRVRAARLFLRQQSRRHQQIYSVVWPLRLRRRAHLRREVLRRTRPTTRTTSQSRSRCNVAEALLWFFLFEVFFCISVVLIKASIAMMLIRIAGPMKRFIWSLYACIAVFTIMNVVSLFYIVFQCSPVS